MVDLALTSRCFHAVSMAWNSLKQPYPARIGSPDFDWTPVRSPLDIAEGDLQQFQWKSLHAVWSSDSWDQVPNLYNGLLESGHDYSIYFEPFGVNIAQCQSDEVWFPAIKDALYEEQTVIQRWEDELERNSWNDEL